MSATELHMTRHATTRFAQRGFRDGDAELIMDFGTEVEGGYLVRRKDVPDIGQWPKRLQEQIRRLIGKRMVVAGNAVLSGYHAKPSKEHRLLRDT